MTNDAAELPTRTGRAEPPEPARSPATSAPAGPPQPADTQAAPEPARGRLGRFARRYAAGLGTVSSAFAVVFAAASLTPSLVPRGWLVQGVLTGVCALSGYAVGSVVAWAGRKLDPRHRFGGRARTRVRRVLGVVAVVGLAAALVAAPGWDHGVRQAIGAPDGPPGWQYVLVPVVAFVVAAPVLAFARLLRRVTRRVARVIGRLVPAGVAQVVSVALVGALTWGIFSGVLWARVIDGLNLTFERGAAAFDPGLEPPTAPERSGSPQSPQSWDSLGREGRRFVTGGPTVDDIRRFEAALPSGGVPAAQVAEPIRVYSGMDGGIDASAANVVAELDRTHAWDRGSLLVVTTTGSGWVDSAMVDSFELLHGGDTAIATMQYSYLPSWLAFVGDRTQPVAAATALFSAVYARWTELPPDDRPQLYVAGISLGSFGMQSAFSGPQDVAARTDGALFVGTPNFTPMWHAITEGRDPGSRQVSPVFEGGQRVRFSTGAPGGPGDPLTLAGPWDPPHVVYTQHGSDGVTWWSPATIWSAPDWLREPRAADVSTSTRWFPVVTFWQLTADLFFSADSSVVPRGAGHRYELEYADGFAAIGAPDGWTAADTDVLRSAIGARQATDG